jgi:hypothetical protein
MKFAQKMSFSAAVLLAGLVAAFAASAAFGQSNSGIVSGSVTDSTGALIPGAAVTITNSVSGFTRSTTSDSSGKYRFYNLPFDPYRVTAREQGFSSGVQTVTVVSTVPAEADFKLLATASTSVTVTATDILPESDPNFHTDIDRTTIDTMPIESVSSELSSIVTLASPGVAADSNGLIHGLGDHNEVSFSVDGQPITDQQSKVFSNQLPAAAVQSIEVLDGAPSAEFGDKTSLIVKVTTRSGYGVKTPHGSISGTYGTFGTSNFSADLARGGDRWGNFVAIEGIESGRFLDAPEFNVMHDKGNEENLFDRVDFNLSDVSTVHINGQYTRSWFQTPNSYDTSNVFDQNGNPLGPTDQRSKIQTISLQPTYNRVLSKNADFNFGPYMRFDSYHYYPSKNPFADLGPIQQESLKQERSLTNVGAHSELSYLKGHNNVTFGGMYEQTFLRENLQFGLVDPTLNAPGSSNFNPVLAPYDLTRGGHDYSYHGQTDVKQLALYGKDQITAGNWLIDLGLRGDFYNGLAVQRVAEPRVGISYTIHPTATVLRVSYARTQETPFNENLVLSSNGCDNPVVQAVFLTIGPCNPAPFNPGFRNEFHAGIQQSIGHYLAISADYITKYTHNAYDFSIFGATPVFFPIEWKNSKIPGYAGTINLTPVHGFSASFNASSVSARFFNPQIGGVGATIAQGGTNYPFRIDHDQRFNQTTLMQYRMPFRKSLIYAFTWRYDSGLVAGSTPCYNATDPNSACSNFSFDANGNPLVAANGQPLINLSGFTPDEEFQAGLTCAGVHATPTQGLMYQGQSACLASQLTSKLVNIPAPGTEDDDKNPQRIQGRNLFDMSLGDDRVIGSARHSLGARVTVINATNKYALYNFLSTFSGTHYVTPRTVSGQIAYHF